MREGSIILFFNADVNFAIEDNLIFEIKKKRGEGVGVDRMLSACSLKNSSLVR